MAELPKNILERKKILDEIKYPGSVVIKKSASTGSESAKNGSAAPINDPVVNVQRRKEEAAQPEAASVPRQSQIRADAARKRLERLRTDYDAKVKARTDKQKEDQFYSDLMTGDPSVIAPIAAPDEEENRLRRQMEQADREAKYWEAEAEKERNQKVTEQDMADVQEWDEADREELEKYIQNREAARVQSFSPFATGLPTEYENSPLIDKYGRERLDEIARSYQREQNRQKYGQAEQTGREEVNGGLFSAIGANAASVGANIADTLLSPLQRVAQMAAGTDDRYSTLDPYAGGQAAAYASGVRQQSMENIEGEDPNLVRKGLSIVYQGTMAAADSLARAAVGGSSTVGMGLASLGSFNRTLTDASAKGASPDQALALAAINSGIEAATEKLPMDELFKLARSGAKPAAQVVKNVLKQMGIEILEEEASLIGTTLAEAAILQEKSGYNQQIMQAAAQGVPYEQAKADANRALLAEAINTALVSGVSGGISAGGAEIYAARFGGTETARQPEQTETEPAPRKPEAAQAEEQTQTQENAEQTAEEVPEPDADILDTDNVFEGLRQEQADQMQAAEDDWMRQTFEEAEKNAQATKEEAERKSEAQKADADRATNKNRQKQAYEAVKAEQRKVNQLEKDIVKAEQKLKETGKGSQARIDQMRQELERQKGIVAQKQRFLDYQDSSYDTNLERAVKTQQDLYENARMQVTLAIADYNDGRISEAQLQDAKDTYNNAGQELYRLKNMTPEQYRMELVSVGLLGDLAGRQNTARQSVDTQTAQAQAPIETAQQSQNAAETPLQKVTDTVTETITRKPTKPTQTSTQQVDTQEQSAEGGQAEQTQKQTVPQTGDVKMQRARPDDVRPITVPVTDPQGKRVSEAAGNAQGSELTPDSMAKEIEQLVADGNLGFDVRTNRESLENAAAEINKKGPANVRNRITRSIESRKIKDGDIEQAILLYQKYANGDKDTDLDNASEMMVDLATMANITGRNLQLFKLLRKMTPEGQLLAVQKEVERNVQSLVSSGKVKKGYEAQIDESLKTEYLNAAKELQKAQKGEDAAKIAEAEQKVKDAQNAIYASEAAKMPATFKAKWDAWRYMAMLGNAKTQVRNVAGNLAFEPYKIVKDKMAALVEKSLPQDQRTKSLVQDPALLKWAREDRKTEDVTNALKYSAKLGDNTAKDQISEQMKVFDNKALEAARKFVAKVPQAGDMLFKNDYYSRSLAGFLKARGYTAAQVQSGQVSDAILNEARSYAINEAMKATFNDSNAFSDAISSIGRGTQDNPWKKALNVAAEGILPFRRTPANIIVRFTEYSPAGIAKGMWDMATHVRNGDMSAATAIDQITAGLTGTGVMMLGYMMAAGMNGIKLTGSGADEDEKRQGHQDYALEFSADGQEYSYKIDWAAPANLPLFVGANIYNAIKDAGADPDVSKLTAVIRGMNTAFEPMLSLSCLSSLNDLFESGKYSDDSEALYTAAATIATSYFTQGIPALLRQGYQATQETKQTTFANDADPTIRDLQKTAANIPVVGAEFQTEKVNAWGETEDQGDWMARTFNSFINPGSLKKIDNSALEQEITRLNEVQTENVTPPTAGKTLSYTDKDGNAHNDVRLTEEQYQTLAQTQGQTAKRILDEMIASKDYKALNDEQKALAIQQAYSYARKTAEIAAIEDHTGYDDAWMIDMQGRNEAAYIMRRIANNSLNSAFTALDTAWDKGYNEKGRSDRLEWAYDAFKAMTPQAKKEVKEWATGTTAKYIEARENGITNDQFLSAAENVAKVTGTGSNGTVRDIDRRQAIAKTSGLTEQQKDKIMKVYMEDYDPADDSPATTELKYDYIRHGLGLTAEQYAETYRASLDHSKKNDKIAAIMELGYDKKTATALYNVYGSTTKGKKAYMGYYNSK